MCGLTILLAGIPSTSAVPVQAAFDVTSWSGASGAGQATLMRGHLVLADGEARDGLRFEFHARHVRAQVWETTRLYAPIYTFEPYVGGPSLVDEQVFDDVFMRVATLREGWFVGALDFESAILDSPDEIRVLPPMDGVVLAGVTAYRMHSSDGFEPFRYRHPGTIQPFHFAAFSALVEAPSRAIVLNGTLEARTDQGSRLIDPYNDYPRPEGPIVNVIRWITLDIQDGRLVVSPGESSRPDMEQAWYAERALFDEVPDFWIDKTSGTVEVNSTIFQLEGSRLVAHGNFSLQIAPTADSSHRAYTVGLDGDATSLRTSDGAILDAQAGVLTLVGAAGVGALLMVLMRDFVARAVGFVGLPLYTKLRKPQLLDHERRQSLYDAIKGDPGVTFLQLHQKLKDQFGRAGGFGFGALTYHLSQLEHFGLIVSKREGRFRRYFENGGKFGRDTKRIAILQTPPVPSVVEILVAEPGASQTRIHAHVAKSYPVTRQAVGYHLKRLQKKELLEVRRAGKANAYFPTEKLEELAEFAQAKTASLEELKADRASS